jgi:hypothetical protein
MSQLLQVISSFPTVVFTILMVAVVLYWLLVILGALDLDFLGGGDGAADGAAEGVGGDGGGDLGGHDVGDGGDVGDHGGDAGDGDAGDHGGDGHHGHGLGALLSALGLRKAPVTVVFSLIVFFAWALTIIGSTYLGAPLARLPGWLGNTLLVVAALVLAMLAASLASRPLGRVFVTHQAPSRRTLVGRTCVITTGSVSGEFGQASVEDGMAGMVVQVRCDRENPLKRGDRARLVAYDAKREAFLVEPDYTGSNPVSTTEVNP